MAQINKSNIGPRTFEGGAAVPSCPLTELKRTVLSCMLWENAFYESGESTADRIKALVPLCKPEDVAELVVYTRSEGNLRHAPLLLARELARNAKGRLVGDTIAAVIQRADELAEFLAIYWAETRQPLSSQVKQGLARAFRKFNEYDFAKYNRDNKVKLRDVLFLCHAKPADEAQEALWKRLISGELQTPDTWEVQLSSGADKLETWRRLLAERKLGALAFLRNLRNMVEVGVPDGEIWAYASTLNVSRVLPYRYIAAARAAPRFEPMLESLLVARTLEQPRLKGSTVVLVDTSGSMNDKLSSKSDMRRIDAAAALAMILAERCERLRVFTFDTGVEEIPPRRGFALRDAIGYASGGTDLGKAVRLGNQILPDRLVVITDEQSNSNVGAPRAKGYMLNVGTYQNGVGFGPWIRINGFSDASVEFIFACENAR